MECVNSNGSCGMTRMPNAMLIPNPTRESLRKRKIRKSDSSAVVFWRSSAVALGYRLHCIHTCNSYVAIHISFTVYIHIIHMLLCNVMMINIHISCILYGERLVTPVPAGGLLEKSTCTIYNIHYKFIYILHMRLVGHSCLWWGSGRGWDDRSVAIWYNIWFKYIYIYK